MIKNISKNLVGLLFVLTLMTSCTKKDEPASALDVLKKQLAIGWKIKFASLDGKDVTSYYPNLAITFNSSSFTTTNGVLPLWKPTMNFNIVGANSPFHLLREDGIDMTVVSVDATKLVMEFQYDAVKLGGRLQSVSGNYHIELSPM